MKTSLLFIVVVIVFLSFTKVALSQNTDIDSLKIELQKHTKKDTLRVNLLYKIAFSSFHSDLELTKSYLTEAETLSHDLDYTKGKAKVLYLKGILESRKSNYKTSLDYFNNSLKLYESIKDQKGIAAIYAAFGITHFVQSQYEKALNNYKKSSEIFEILDDKRELANSYIYIANVYAETGKYNESILNFKKALEISESINDENGISYVNRNIGFVYKMQGNYPLAIDNYNKSFVYTKKNKDTLGMAIQLNNLGDTYNILGKYDKALEYHNQSLKLSLKKENKEQIAINNGNIGNIYLQKKEFNKAIGYYTASLKVSEEINNRKQVAICYLNIGELNVQLNEFFIARKNFLKAKKLSQKINFKHVLAASYLGVAETYLYENENQKALVHAQKGRGIAEELHLIESEKKAAELLSKIYNNTGKYKNAFESHQQFKILNDSLFNKKNIEKIAQLEYEYKYQQALDSASIRELELTKTVTETNKNLAKTQRNYLWAIIGVLLVTMFLGSVIFYQKLKHAKAKTQNAVIEQKLLRSQMTPHFIFNSLSVLQGMILNKEEKKSVSYLSKFSKLLRITLENSRNKMVSLEQELKAIQNYLTLQNLENDAYQSTILVEDSVDVTIFEVPPMLIQPFVENAIEHAFKNIKEDKRIDIRLKYEDLKLICTIADNGIGYSSQNISKNAHKKSLSTVITSERLKILSKDFNMEGSVSFEDRKVYNEQGTIVTLVIPHKIISV